MAGGKITVLKPTSSKQPSCRTLVDDNDYSDLMDDLGIKSIMDLIRKNILIDQINVDLLLMENTRIPFKKKQFTMQKDLSKPCRFDEDLPPLYFTVFQRNEPPMNIHIGIRNGRILIEVGIANKDNIVTTNHDYTPDHISHEMYLSKHGISGSETYILHMNLIGHYNQPVGRV